MKGVVDGQGCKSESRAWQELLERDVDTAREKWVQMKVVGGNRHGGCADFPDLSSLGEEGSPMPLIIREFSVLFARWGAR